jgi:glutamate N-acetyltransferase/amino-acid N-acetyltransferase
MPMSTLVVAAWALVGHQPLSHGRQRAARVDCCTFDDESSYLSSLEGLALPDGFRVGTAGFEFAPAELGGASTASMKLTLIALDEPTSAYAAVFTRNRFPGAPVRVGRARLAAGEPLQAVVVNNKISNVCAAGGGVDDAEEVCTAAARALDLAGGASAVLPLSTGVIGWRLPVAEMVEALPAAAAQLGSGTALAAATSIMTTDRYPKLRVATACGGSLVGFAKGAGMIEPDMATMLAVSPPLQLLRTFARRHSNTPLRRPLVARPHTPPASPRACAVCAHRREHRPGRPPADARTRSIRLLQRVLGHGSHSAQIPMAFRAQRPQTAWHCTHCRCSVDADQSTSDSLVCLSSATANDGALVDDAAALAAFEAALTSLCSELAQDVVRNGEGTRHVMRVGVTNAPDTELARGVGKAVVNSPLFKAAVAGDDPNVGRLVAAVGSYLGRAAPDLPLDGCTISIGGRELFAEGAFRLDADAEAAVHAHLVQAGLAPPGAAALPYPPHQRCVEVCIDLGAGDAQLTVHGSDLTNEYVAINADYRS